MGKKLLAFCMAIGVLFACIIPAQAAARDIAPSAQLTIDGDTATCKVTIVKAGKSIQATMELWQGNTRIDSWSGNKTSYLLLSGTHRVTAGKTYTLKVICTIDGEDYYVRPVSKTA